MAPSCVQDSIFQVVKLWADVERHTLKDSGKALGMICASHTLPVVVY